MTTKNEATQVQLHEWRIPSDLQPASFDDSPKPIEPKIIEPTIEPAKKLDIADKLLPLIGKINSGGLDMSTILGLLDQSGQGLGALGKLLPLVAPLLQGGLNKKKSTEDIVDLSTINLDN